MTTLAVTTGTTSRLSAIRTSSPIVGGSPSSTWTSTDRPRQSSHTRAHTPSMVTKTSARGWKNVVASAPGSRGWSSTIASMPGYVATYTVLADSPPVSGFGNDTTRAADVVK